MNGLFNVYFCFINFSKTSGYLFLIASRPIRRAFKTIDVKNHKLKILKCFEQIGWEIFSGFHALKNHLYSIISKRSQRYVPHSFASYDKSFYDITFEND